MFFPESRVRVFLYGQPVDMRKCCNGLIALTRRGLGQDPLSGHVFVFVNPLYFDRSGFCLWAKRLEQGQFISDWRRCTSRELDVPGLKLLLKGIEPARQRLRSSATPSQEMG